MSGEASPVWPRSVHRPRFRQFAKQEGRVDSLLSALGVVGGAAVCTSGAGTPACVAGILAAKLQFYIDIGVIAVTVGAGGYKIAVDAKRLAKGDQALVKLNSNTTNRTSVAVQLVVGDPKLQNLMDNIYKGASNPNRVGDGTLADAVRYENATGGTVGGKTHTVKAQETIRGLQNWLDRNTHALQSDKEEAITQIQRLQDALVGG